MGLLLAPAEGLGETVFFPALKNFFFNAVLVHCRAFSGFSSKLKIQRKKSQQQEKNLKSINYQKKGYSKKFIFSNQKYKDKKGLFSLSFTISGDKSLTRPLQSSPFQNKTRVSRA